MPYPFTSAYNASKAALAQWSETLRIELEPLQIKVVTVVTGQVATNLPKAPVFPESSIYRPVQSPLEARAKAHVGTLCLEISTSGVATLLQNVSFPMCSLIE